MSIISQNTGDHIIISNAKATTTIKPNLAFVLTAHIFKSATFKF